MPFAEAKRKFLVNVLGEARVKALEEALPRMERELEERGVGWKAATSLQEVMIGYTDIEEEASVVVAVTPVGPTTFQEVEKEDAAREKGAEVRSLTGTFEFLLTNIMALPVEDQAEKVRLLEKAMHDLTSRITEVGSKAVGSSPAAQYVQDLTGAKSDRGGTAVAVKELRERGEPAADLVADLISRGAVEGRS